MSVSNLFFLNKNGVAQRLVKHSQKNPKKSLAPLPRDVVAFRKHTQEVWSKLAKRPISPGEADQIIEEFGLFLRVLSSENGEEK